MAWAKHFADAYSGRVFSQSVTPLGLALPIYTATAIGGAGICGLPLWNPPSSGVMVELICVDIDYGSGTADYGSVGLMAGPLSAIGTATGCSALAVTQPVSGYLLANPATKVQSSNSAGTTTVTAGVATPPVAGTVGAGWVRSLADFNLEAQTGTAHGTGVHTYNFDGTVCVPPGVLIYFAASKATVALYAATLVWKEVSLPPR